VRGRKLTRAERFGLYGVAGWAMEIVFTAASRQLDGSGDRKLQGHTYLWMLPIYGLTALLFDPVQRRVAHRPPAVRSAAYAAAFVGVEYGSGALLRKVTGVCPWDYTGRSRFVVDGVTRLDYAPLWALAGLGVERLDRLFDRVRIVEDGAE
jgi:uncharacterized membrane protein